MSCCGEVVRTPKWRPRNGDGRGTYSAATRETAWEAGRFRCGGVKGGLKPGLVK